MPYLFSNNAESTLANLLPSSSSDPDYNTIVITDADEGNTFLSPSEVPDGGQLATLTHPSLPGIYEVVRIRQHAYGATDFTVERGYELGAWAVQEWPIGTKMQARITAKMLRAFPQQDIGGMVVFTGSLSGSDDFAYGTRPVLRDQRGRITNGSPPTSQDTLFAPEVVGGSFAMDLGVAATWGSTTPYYGLAVVQPATPDGFQYFLDLRLGESRSQTNVTPAFDGTTSPTVAHDGNTPGNKDVGFWVPTALPIDVSASFDGNSKLVVTEVGFMAREVTAGDTPSVSIGTSGNPTKFVNNQALSQITGSNQVHRFPITAGGEMVSSLRYVVNTAATGGVFRGRFYWRGFFLNDLE